MEKASYSLSAIRHCKQLVQNTFWSARLKSEHYSRSAEINSLFASCQELLNSILFCPDLSPAMTISKWSFPKSIQKPSSTTSYVFAVLRFCGLCTLIAPCVKQLAEPEVVNESKAKCLGLMYLYPSHHGLSSAGIAKHIILPSPAKNIFLHSPNKPMPNISKEILSWVSIKA